MSNAPAVNTQEDQIDSPDNQIKFLLGLAFILVSPITILSAGLVYALFSYGRIKRSVISVMAAPFFVIPLFFIEDAWNSFVASWMKTFPQIINAEEKFPVVMHMLGQQFWLAVPAGIIAGLAFASWRWFNRARWKDFTFRKTPWELYTIKRTIKKIKNDEDTPPDGMTLGIDKESSDRIVQTYAEASGQTFLVGGSGSGKTRTALTRIRDQIKNGDGVCIVDLKGDPEVANIAQIYCDRYGKKMQHFTLQDILSPYEGPSSDGPAHYDPLAQGDHTRRADMVLDLRDWTNAEFYKKLTQSYLQLLFTVHINNPPKEGKSALEDAIELMSPKYLQERARPLVNNKNFRSIINSIDALNDERMSSSVRENLQTNRSQLEIFVQGVAGPWLSHDPKGNNISLLDAARNGDVVVFSLDSLAYPSLAGDIANLIIQDLKTVSSELLRIKNDKPFHVFIDEFSSIGSDNIVGLINKARASNMFVTIATQTLGDLMVHNPALKDQILGIISSFIIHRANTENDAKVYAGLTGTITKSVMSHKVDYSQNIFGGLGVGVGIGGGTVSEVEQFTVMPKMIQELNVGEMYYINTSSHRIKRVQCIIEDIADPTKGGTDNALNSSTPEENTITSKSNEILSLDKTDSVPTLAELIGKEPKHPSESSSPVNQQLTAESFNNEEAPKQKATPQMLDKLFGKKNKSAQTSGNTGDSESAKQAFDEVRDMEKVEINYDLLRTFFNDPKLVDEQEQEDIADGVAPAKSEPLRKPSPTTNAPQVKASPVNPVTPVSRPVKASPFAPKQSGGNIPASPIRPNFPVSRPQVNKPTPPSKSEYDF